MALVFLDFEASSLLPGSFPIEVAWVLEGGTGESHLIKPADGWLDPTRGNPGWSPESERVHGIPLSTLTEQGKPAEEVATRVAAVLSSPQVLACSDAPDQDGYWLRRLYEAGGIRRDASLVDVRRVYGMSCRPLLDLLPPLDDPDHWRVEQRVRNLSAEIVARAEEAEHVRQRVRHRALADAQALWCTHVAIRQEVARHLREAGR